MLQPFKVSIIRKKKNESKQQSATTRLNREKQQQQPESIELDRKCHKGMQWQAPQHKTLYTHINIFTKSTLEEK